MDTIERVMSYLADMRERGDDRAKELFQALADLPEPEFEAPEGYHTTKVFTSEDCDHGPCIGHTFADGWVMYTYTDDLARVSFHHPDEEDLPLKSYKVVVTQTSVLNDVQAANEDDAVVVATNDYIWDEVLNIGEGDTSFSVGFDVEESDALKSYDVEIKATVRKTITVEAGDEKSAAEQAHEEFTVASDGPSEHYEQDTLSITETNTHD